VSRPADLAAEVVAHRVVAPGFKRMELALPRAVRFAPGQFFQLLVHPGREAPLLRRPFAPSEVAERSFAFVYAVVGRGTEALAALRAGASVRVLAPLGTGWTLPARGGRAVLVGGGCGTPSLRVLAEALLRRKVEVHGVIGARSACALLEERAFARLCRKLEVATDDGSKGLRGHAVAAATRLLDSLGPGAAPRLYACGPHPMLRGLAGLAAERGLFCEVSLEERMACGFGACMGCAVRVRADNEDGFVYRRVCHDGPVFAAADLLW